MMMTVTPTEKFNFVKRQIELRKQEIAQTQGMINMVKKQLKEMGINSKQELDSALSEAKTKYEAARVDYENKMKRFEDAYKDFFGGEIC